MPPLVSYAKVAPFGIEELVESANSVLRHRPRLQTTIRTVRFYASRSLLPKPSGAPKLARYGMEHLGRLVAIRCLQDQGVSLEDIADQLDQTFSKGQVEALRWVQDLVDGKQEEIVLFDAQPPQHNRYLLHSPAPLTVGERREDLELDADTSYRIRLTPEVVLEVSTRLTPMEGLRDAQREIVRKLHDTT
jgi:DNA-binding transcriptional MerR regulator